MENLVDTGSWSSVSWESCTNNSRKVAVYVPPDFGRYVGNGVLDKPVSQLTPVTVAVAEGVGRSLYQPYVHKQLSLCLPAHYGKLPLMSAEAMGA